MPETRSARQRPETGERGLSLAVADVGWFNTENLFRELDRESVDVLLLKCFDYVNGWRRGLYPWSPACRLRRSGDSAWEQQLVLPSGWMKRFPGLGMRPIARSIRQWWGLQPRTWRRGLVMSYPHYIHLHNLLEPGCFGLLQHRRLRLVLACARPSKFGSWSGRWSQPRT